MPDFRSVSEVMSLPLWGTAVVAAIAALTAMLAVFAILRFGGRQVLGIAAAAAVVIGLGWFALDRLDFNGKVDQRRAIEARLSALSAQALAPNSNLACLDAAGGDVIHEACEKALFASPEQVAAALNYVGARLDTLREIAALPERDQAAYESLRTPIVRSMEADRFGLVAQVLAARDGCQPGSCYAFAFLKRKDQLVANMTESAYESRVGRFATVWNGDKPGATAAAAPTLAAQTPPHPAAAPSSLNVSFPSAASIPPVSIMSNEPGRPGQNGVDATAKPEPVKQEAARPEPRSQAEPRAPAQSQPPAQSSPRRPPQQKAQSQRPAPPQPAAPPPPAASGDPFPPPVGSQTTGSQPQQ